MANLFNEDFLEYIDLLNQEEVEYVLVGGMAVNLYGYRRATGDMDIFVNPTPENHAKLSKVHRRFGMMMGEMESLENFLDTDKYDVYTFGVSPIQIDVMTKCKGIAFEMANASAVQFEADSEIFVNVIHYRQLIETKSATNRTRDKADVEELEKIKRKKL